MVLGPQTIGPFSSRRARLLARRSMSTARLVMARDTVSAGHARRLGHVVDVSTTDVVFALPAPARTFERDVLLNVSGLLWQPSPHLDHSAYEQFYGGKLGIDATRKLPTEGYHRAGGWPTECVLDDATRDLVERRWSEYGLS